MKQPTIAELEAIMAEKNVEIDIRPNGEVYVKSELQDAIQRAESAEAEAGRLRGVLETCHERARLGGPGLAGEAYALLDIFNMISAALQEA